MQKAGVTFRFKVIPTSLGRKYFVTQMHILYKCANLLQKPLFLRSCRKLYAKVPEINTVDRLGFNVRRNIRVYTTISLSAAGAVAFYSVKSPSEGGISTNGCIEPSPSIYVPLEGSAKSTRVDILSVSTLCSLIIADLPYLIMAILGAFGAAYFNIRIPTLLGDIINVLTKIAQTHSISFSALQAPSLRLCGAISLQSLCTFLYIGFLATVGERIACRLRAMLFEHVIYQNVRFFDEKTSGWIIERLTADVQDFKSSFKHCVSQGLRNGAQIVGSSVAMYRISPTLTAALLGCLPLVFLVGSLIGSQLRRMSHAAHEKTDESTDIASEAFTHIRSVKSLAIEAQMIDQYYQSTCEACRLHEYLGYGIGCFQGLSNFAMNSLVLGVLYLGGNLMSRGDLDAGDLMAFLVATQSLHRSLAQISLLFGHVIRGASAAAHISEVLSYSVSSEATLYTKNVKMLPEMITFSTPVIRFENVTFCYPNRPGKAIFKDLSFEIPAGKVVALVGESGAGKSTVLALLERFYEPITGKITLDGVDIRDISLSQLRGHLLGYISQEPEIFHNTVAENIRCARPLASQSNIEAAAKAAQADDFIRDRLNGGYNAMIGGGSSTASAGLSGGQRQRLVIARALLKNAPILLLDEATSALDAESEFQVQSALQKAMQGK
ncbi:unnamed protein product [Hymenolepis diminuta]|uniref:Mitochondrial potassium channel ATP-binding subunit n=1 Tax=Hymenolepis diminuta TaxID=6216 RepID=A0A0R3SQG9_HYMDI|nr:unnamed protein product [Hymenolepis diminuta]